MLAPTLVAFEERFNEAESFDALRVAVMLEMGKQKDFCWGTEFEFSFMSRGINASLRGTFKNGATLMGWHPHSGP